MYNIDFVKLVEMLLPTVLRMPRLIAFMSALTAPIRQIYSEFLDYRSYALNELNHNGQIIYLEKYLNDRFDNDLRRIWISDGVDSESPYYYTYREVIGPVMRTFQEDTDIILRTNHEEYATAEFIVNIDNSVGDLFPDLNELQACIDLRKTPGTVYEINIIN